MVRRVSRASPLTTLDTPAEITAVGMRDEPTKEPGMCGARATRGRKGGSDSTHITDLDAPGLAFSSTPSVSTAMHLSATLMGVACSAVRPGHRQQGRTGQAVRPGTMTDSLLLEAHGWFQHGWVESVGAAVLCAAMR